MKNKKILTISVASYNVENFIEKNLESFINSEVKDLIEVIVTDDESTDKTTDIVQRYVDKYPNTIKLVKQKNKGPGSTVNSGIKHATGKYFRMVDGDDWVVTENLNILVKKLQEIDVDMVITNHKCYSDADQNIIKGVNFNLKENLQLEIGDINKNNQVIYMHNVTYKTSILKENNIQLSNGFYTDNEYLLLPIPYIKNIIYYNMDLYIYRVARQGQSVSAKNLKKNINNHWLMLEKLIKYYEEKKETSEDVRKFFISVITRIADNQLRILLMFKANKINRENIKKFFQDVALLSQDIHTYLSKKKKTKILLLSNYVLYMPLVWIIRLNHRD